MYSSDGLMFIGGALLFLLVILMAILVLTIVGLWKLFKKAGRHGWEAIVPFYSNWVLVEISGLSWWYFFLIISSSISVWLELESFKFVFNIANLVGTFFCYYNIAKKLHKDVGTAILMTIFPYVMFPLIGLSSKYQYDPNVIVSENGPIASKNGNTTQANSQYPNESKSVNSNSYDTNIESTANQGSAEKNFCSKCGKPLEENARFCGNCGSEIL